MWTLMLRRICYIHYESFVSPDKLLTQVLLILPYSLFFLSWIIACNPSSLSSECYFVSQTIVKTIALFHNHTSSYCICLLRLIL